MVHQISEPISASIAQSDRIPVAFKDRLAGSQIIWTKEMFLA